MSRILDYVLEPSVVYTNGSFLVKVKVQDDYKYKKLLVSENMKYTTVTGTTYTLTNAVSTNNASIYQLEGNTTQNGTPTPTSPVEVSTVSGDNEVVVCGKNKLDISNMQTGTKNGITITKNDTTGEITISGTATAYTPYNIPCNLSGNNTYSCDNWGSFTLYFQYNGTGVSNATANKTYNGNVNNIVLAISNGTTINKTIKLQVEKRKYSNKF